MNVLILGAGNLLLSDEGFGVHFIRHLEAHYDFPEGVELLDAGTLGLLVGGSVEAADRVYLVDVVQAEGLPGEVRRYGREDLLLGRLPVKLSPHQVGVQEMLLVSEMRGRCPREVFFLGVLPASLEPGCALSPALQPRLKVLAELLVTELRDLGFAVRPRGGGLG